MTELHSVLCDLYSKIFKEGLHSQKKRKRMKSIFAKSRMAEANRRLNQTLDQTTQLFDADAQFGANDITQLDADADGDGYLKTERGGDDEPDYRESSARSRPSVVETEAPAASELRADVLEFLR